MKSFSSLFAAVLVPMLAAGPAWSMETIERLLKIELPSKVEFCGEKVPLDREDVWERLDFEMISILGNPVTTAMWFKRANRYFPLITAIAREKNLHEDLKYVAVIESNLRPDAVSPSGATGPWQFMPPTGEQCGLDQDDCIDERRDWELSTRAALDYLSDLRIKFGTWPLALAAYNGGEGRVARSLDAQGEYDFYGLNLPRETERYVFRAIAAKIVMENPFMYGIDLEEARLYGPDGMAPVDVTVEGPSLPLRDLAKAAGLSFRRFADINPVILGTSLPKGSHRLYIPADRRAEFLARFDEVQRERARYAEPPPPPPKPAPEKNRGKKAEPAKKRGSYVVKKGDTLSSIARRFDTDVATLCTLNGISPKQAVRTGQTLTVPGEGGRQENEKHPSPIGRHGRIPPHPTGGHP